MFSTTSGAAKLSLIVVIGLIVFKVVVSVITGSISISAQAADSSLDLFAIAIIFFAVRMASKPADEQLPFGHGRVESVAATGQAALLFTASGVIIYLAVQRIIKGTTIELTEAGIGVMLVSIIVSIFLSRHLLKVSRATDSVAIEALARNIAADVYSAAGVLAALAAIRFTGLSILDPIIAVVVAFFILKAARNVMTKSFGELVDVRLPKTEQDEIVFCIKEHTGQLVGFHEIRTRKAGNQRFIDLHLVMPRNVSVEEAHLMCDHLEQDIKNRLPNSSITIHVEPCSTECDQCTTSSCSLRKQSL